MTFVRKPARFAGLASDLATDQTPGCLRVDVDSALCHGELSRLKDSIDPTAEPPADLQRKGYRGVVAICGRECTAAAVLHQRQNETVVDRRIPAALAPLCQTLMGSANRDAQGPVPADVPVFERPVQDAS